MKPLPELGVRIGADRDSNIVGALGGNDLDRARVESAADGDLFSHC